MDKQQQKVSFVIPVYNEAESLQLLYDGIMEQVDFPYEIIFVDDGSTDGSPDIVKALREKDPDVHLIAFRKNMGKAAALEAGFRNVTGDIVLTMDADLQDDPEEIPHFLDKINEGYDLVSGWKFERNDPVEKTLPSRLFNKVVSSMSGIQLHDFNCGFKAYRCEVVDAIDLYGEMHRYIPVLAGRKGFRIAEIKVNHNKRQFGASKYGMERYLRGFFDSLTAVFLSKYYDKPMHFFGRLGLVSLVIGLLICLVLTIQWLFGQPLSSRPLLQLGILAILVGVQLFSIGLIGDMIVAGRFRSGYEESHIKEKL